MEGKRKKTKSPRGDLSFFINYQYFFYLFFFFFILTGMHIRGDKNNFFFFFFFLKMAKFQVRGISVNQEIKKKAQTVWILV